MATSPTSARWGSTPRPGTTLLVAAVSYYAVAQLGLRLALVGHSVTPLWPASGFALVAFLVFGRRVWPAIALAAFAVNVPISPNLLAAGAIAVGNTLAPLLAAALLTRVGFDRALGRVRDAFALVFLAALLGMTVSATIGSLTLVWSGAVSQRNLPGTWSVWWTGDAMGILVVAPVLLLLVAGRPVSVPSRNRLEVAIVTILLAASCGAAFASTAHFMFLVLPVLGWIAWRFEQPGAAPATLLVSILATLAAVHQTGPFADGSLVQRMIVLQSFNATAAFTGILVAAAVAQRERFAEREHRVAETLQRSLLPDQLPYIPEVASASRYIPASADIALGGDWYDVVALPDGRVAFAVGDVAGHGVAAAAAMGQLRVALRAYALEHLSPGQALRRCNRMLRDIGPTNMATAWYGCYDPQSHLLEYTSAGHLPALLIDTDAGRVSYLEDVHGPPLGTLADISYGQTQRELPSNSSLVLYTDGLIERRGSPLDDGLHALQEAARAAPRDLELLCDHLIDALGSEPSKDDIAVLALRPVSLTEASLRFSHDASPHALRTTRRMLRSWLAEHGTSEQEIFDILVAVSEAHTNSIQHAYVLERGPVHTDAVIADTMLHITVRDCGTWSRPTREPVNGGGHGLVLMRTLMDSVEIEAGGDGTEVRMQRALKRPAPA